jgi:enamine deaminase RidA (YjgF/YER057c/UK114 family)
VERAWYPRDLEQLGSPPTVVRAGPFVFVSAQVARDFESGRLIRRLWDLPSDQVDRLSSGYEHEDGREGPIKAQATKILDNLELILAAEGLSRRDIVRQRLYLRNVRDLRAAQDVVLDRFTDGLPATTIATMSSLGVDPDILLEIEIFALDPRASELPRSTVRIDGLDALTAPYPLGVRVGQLLFTSGLLGLNLSTGHLAMQLEEVEPGIRAFLDTGSFYRNASEEAYKSQIAMIHAHLQRILESQGGTFKHLVKENHLGPYGVSEPGEGMHEWSAWHPMRLGLFPDVETAPTTTSPQTPQVGPDLDTRVMIDAIALLPGPWTREGIEGEAIKMGHLNMLNWAGPLVYITGYLGMDRTLHRRIERYHELEETGRLAGLAHIDSAELVRAQAWRTYTHINALLEEAGIGWGALSHQIVYMRDVASYSILESVARTFGPLPATSVVGVQDAGPFPGLEFEIDCIAFDERRL